MGAIKLLHGRAPVRSFGLGDRAVVWKSRNRMTRAVLTFGLEFWLLMIEEEGSRTAGAWE